MVITRSIFGLTRDFKFQNDQEASDLFINALKTRHKRELRPLWIIKYFCRLIFQVPSTYVVTAGAGARKIQIRTQQLGTPHIGKCSSLQYSGLCRLVPPRGTNIYPRLVGRGVGNSEYSSPSSGLLLIKWARGGQMFSSSSPKRGGQV